MHGTIINDLNVDGNPAKKTTTSDILTISTYHKSKPVQNDLTPENLSEETRGLGIFMCSLAIILLLAYIVKKVYQCLKAIRDTRLIMRNEQDRVRRAMRRNILCVSPRVRYNRNNGSQDSVIVPMEFLNNSDSSDTSHEATYGGAGSTFDEAFYDSQLAGFIGPKKKSTALTRQEEIWSEFFRKPDGSDSIGSEPSKLMDCEEHEQKFSQADSPLKETAAKLDDFLSPMTKKVFRFFVTPVIESDCPSDIDENSSASSPNLGSDLEPLEVILTQEVKSDEKVDNKDSLDQSKGKTVLKADCFAIVKNMDKDKSAKLKPQLSIIFEVDEEPRSPPADKEESPSPMVDPEEQPGTKSNQKGEPDISAVSDAKPPESNSKFPVEEEP